MSQSTNKISIETKAWKKENLSKWGPAQLEEGTATSFTGPIRKKQRMSKALLTGSTRIHFCHIIFNLRLRLDIVTIPIVFSSYLLTQINIHQCAFNQTDRLSGGNFKKYTWRILLLFFNSNVLSTISFLFFLNIYVLYQFFVTLHLLSFFFVKIL